MMIMSDDNQSVKLVLRMIDSSLRSRDLTVYCYSFDKGPSGPNQRKRCNGIGVARDDSSARQQWRSRVTCPARILPVTSLIVSGLGVAVLCFLHRLRHFYKSNFDQQRHTAAVVRVHKNWAWVFDRALTGTLGPAFSHSA